MPRTCAQIVALATQIAKVPGMSIQAGQLLNQALIELTQNYDIALALNTTTIAVSASGPNNGVGPYSLPTNYLRMASREVIFLISGVPYILTQVSLAQFDALINTLGISSYPNVYATNVALTPPGFYLYPPPNLSLVLNIRYYGTLPEIITPEVSTTIPWFPNENYLLKRVTGELMQIAGDPRAEGFLGDGPAGAIGVLRRWLNLQGDSEDTIKTVQLDRRWFGSGASGNFGPSKITGGV
jgi:hypothetical protein